MEVVELKPYLFDEKIKTAESRVFFVTVKKLYGSYSQFSQHFGFSRQYCQDDLMNKGIPLRYASIIARFCGYRPALLNYKFYLLMGGQLSFRHILAKEEFFTVEERKYILKGTRIRNSRSFLQLHDQEFVKEKGL